MTMKSIPTLDMTPVGTYPFDHSPRYKFSVGFPTRGVRVCREVRPTKELAYQDAADSLRNFERADPCGNMGQVLGVTPKGSEFSGVYVVYHSNT